MLSLQFIRENPDAVRKAIREKNVALNLDALLALDNEVRGLKTRVDGLRADRNAISDSFKSAAPEERPALGALGPHQLLAEVESGGIELRVAERSLERIVGADEDARAGRGPGMLRLQHRDERRALCTSELGLQAHGS